MKKFAQSLLALWQQLGLNQRVSLGVAALAVAGGLIAVVMWSRRPDFQLLYARMGDKDSAAVISYLQSQNIPHQITAGGTAVSVPADRVYKLRMDLAGKGIPSGEASVLKFSTRVSSASAISSSAPTTFAPCRANSPAPSASSPASAPRA